MWTTYPNNGIAYWQNSTQIFQNITNSTSPIGATMNSINNAVPWFWPFLDFALYIYLLSLYSDSPSGGKFYMIAALVLVISIFMAFGGLISDAVINLMIFIASFVLSTQFKRF